MVYESKYTYDYEDRFSVCVLYAAHGIFIAIKDVYCRESLPRSHCLHNHQPPLTPDHSHLYSDHLHLPSPIKPPIKSRSTQSQIVRSTVHHLELFPDLTCLYTLHVLFTSRVSRVPSIPISTRIPAIKIKRLTFS